jgi:hypothetical protein
MSLIKKNRFIEDQIANAKINQTKLLKNLELLQNEFESLAGGEDANQQSHNMMLNITDGMVSFLIFGRTNNSERHRSTKYPESVSN